MGRPTKVDATKVAHLIEERGLSQGQVARILHMPVSTVGAACRMHCIVRKGRQFQPKPHASVMRRGDHVVRPFTTLEDELLLRLRMEGAPMADISCALGRNQSSIRSRLQTLARHQEMGVRA